MAFLRLENGIYKLYWYEGGKKRKRSTRSKNKKIAQRILIEFTAKLSAERFDVSPAFTADVRLSEIFAKVIEYGQANKSPTTVKREVVCYRAFANYTGDILAGRIDTEYLEKWKSDLLDSGRSATGINVDYRTLKAAFGFAVKRKYINRNPFREVKPLPEKKKLPRVLNPDQIANLLEQVQGTSIESAVMVALYSGARAAEVCRLTWADVNLHKKEIHLYGKGSKERRVPVPAILTGYLVANTRDDKYVMSAKSRNPEQLSHRFRIYADRAGLTGFRFHDLRHTYASLLANAGASILEIKELLGHTSIQTTLRYSHLIHSTLRSRVDVLDSIGTNIVPAAKRKGPARSA